MDTTQPPDGLPTPRRTLAVLAISIGVVIAVLDQSIANVALPSMARALHTSPAHSIWIVNAYQLAVVATILPAASLGEILGFRRVYLAGSVVFTLASLLCALAPDLPLLVAARVLQGLAAAFTMGVNGALIRFTYPRAMLGRGIGFNAMVVSIAAAVGPGVASAILSVASWPWLFAINLPLGVLILSIGRRNLPSSPRAKHRLDVVSAALNAVACIAFFTSAQTFTHDRSTWVFAIPGFVVALVACAAVVRREWFSPRPLIPIDLLRRPVIGLSVAGSVCSFAGMSSALLTLPFFFQAEMHRSTGMTGLLMTAWPAALAAVALVSGKLSDRFSAASLGGVGMGALTVALVLVATLTPASGNGEVVAFLLLGGLGMGLFQTPNNKTMLSNAPRERAGAASGMLATARLTGMTSGAVIAALMLHFFGPHANRAGCALGAILALTAGVLSVSRRLARTEKRPEPGSGRGDVPSSPQGETTSWTETASKASSTK